MDKEPVPPEHMPDLEFLAKIETLLCVNSPWCKLLATGEKTWELRTYRTQQRPSCNCLGCFFGWFLLLKCFTMEIWTEMFKLVGKEQHIYIYTCWHDPRDIPGGLVGLWQKGSNCIMGVATISDCRPFDKSTKEQTFDQHRVPEYMHLGLLIQTGPTQKNPAKSTPNSQIYWQNQWDTEDRKVSHKPALTEGTGACIGGFGCKSMERELHGSNQSV